MVGSTFLPIEMGLCPVGRRGLSPSGLLLFFVLLLQPLGAGLYHVSKKVYSKGPGLNRQTGQGGTLKGWSVEKTEFVRLPPRPAVGPDLATCRYDNMKCSTGPDPATCQMNKIERSLGTVHLEDILKHSYVSTFGYETFLSLYDIKRSNHFMKWAAET